MATIATNKFRIHNAKSFVEGFSEAAASNLYLFIGRYAPWTASDVVSGAINTTDDNNPPSPPDHNQNIEYESWRSMIAAKRIQSTDVKHVIPRYNWTTGTVYTAYTDLLTNLYTNDVNPFYVITDEFNVYKCLFAPYDSGQSQMTPSTVKPTGSASTPITTADGYVWKYMYTVSASDALKFVTTGYVPVSTLASDPGASACSQEDLQWTVQQGAIDGAIHTVQRKSNASGDSGAGYTSLSGTTPAVPGSQSTLVISEGSATDDVYNGMSLFVNNKLFTISDYVGSTKTLTLSPNIDTTEGAKSYTIAPKVNLTDINGEGSGFEAYCVMSSDKIDSVKVLNKGTGYTQGTITFTDGGSPTTDASYVAVISPKGGHGSDPVKELGGFYVMMNTRLEYDEGVEKLTVDNDYRQIGIVKDPLKADSNLATDALYLQTVALPLEAGYGTFTQDETVTGGTSGATGTVVDQLDISGTQYLRLSNTTGTFQASETVTGGTSSATGDVKVAGPTGAELSRYSGEILYLETRKPITRDSSQLEDLKIILEF